MSEVTGIKRSAPVVGASQIEIAAAPDVVWDVLTTFEQWPRWNRAVESIVAHLRRRPLRMTLDKALAGGLRDLKAEVERRPRSG